jgi:hypothetical protein
MSTKRSLDRREFIAAAGSAAAVAYLPFASLAAAPPVGAAESKELLADWSIDDQWGVYPRYDALPFTPRRDTDESHAAVHAIDSQFLA